MSNFRLGNSAAMFEIVREKDIKQAAIYPAKTAEDHTRLVIGDELTDEDFSRMLGTESTLVDAINECVMFKLGWEKVLDLIDPQSAAVVDETFNNLPIHYACANEAPANVIYKLLEAYPAGASERDWQGKLPLHMALDTQQVDVHAVNSLLEYFPGGAKSRDDNNQIPLQLAIQKNVAAEVLILLALSDLPISEDGQVLNDHEFSWSCILDSEDVSIESSISVVKDVFSRYPEHASALAHSKDRRGREVIDFVRPEVRRFINEYLFIFGRYDIVKGPPVHCSATSIVFFADDYGTCPAERIALKFMRFLDQVKNLG